MSIVVVSCLDWPSEEDGLETVSVQCAGESFLDYQSRRLQHRTFRHGSSFHEDNDVEEEVEEEQDFYSTRDLLRMQHAELEALTYYQVLGDIPMHSSPEQVKRAYHKACLRYHPDKTGRGEEDEVFLKVKAAFDTLSDISKRKAYDSTIDFDDSIPRGGEASHEFYKVYGPVFERNLRFDASNDPERNSKKQNNKKRQQQQKKQPPSLGDDDTPLGEVHAFYDYWIHFDSWRDFTLAATQQTEGNLDVDNAESRYEKRWIMKEIDKKTRALKREEMARINNLVERAMAADPRLKRERQREKEEKERLAQEKRQQMEQERLEQEREAARVAQEQAEREEQEKKEKAAAKANKEKEKKQLRKARQLLRKRSTDAFANMNGGKKVYESLEDMHDDVELLCTELSAVQITELTDAIDANDSTSNAKTLRQIHKRAVQTKEGLAQESINAKQRRDKARKAAAAKEEKAKAAKATQPWTSEELSALAKAVKKYPAGGANRWETIALFVNSLCKPETPRTKEECIEKFNQIANQKAPPKKDKTAGSVAKSASTPSAAWTEEQDKKLQEGLAKYPATMDKNERWTLIAKGVTGKGKKDCVQRFKAIREAIRKK